MVVKFQLYVPLFFSKPTECNRQIFTGFYAYTQKPYSGFFKYLFSETVTGKFEKMKTKAMVLVTAKMNIKVHFNFLILSTKI